MQEAMPHFNFKLVVWGLTFWMFFFVVQKLLLVRTGDILAIRSFFSMPGYLVVAINLGRNLNKQAPWKLLT